MVNEELTVEEWKRLVEKERDMVRRQDRIIEATCQELEKWRKGERSSVLFVRFTTVFGFTGEYVPRSDWVDIVRIAHGTGATPVKSFVRFQSPGAPIAALPSPTEDDADDIMEQDDAESDEQQAALKGNLGLSASYVAEKALLLTKLAEVSHGRMWQNILEKRIRVVFQAECEKDQFRGRIDEIKEQLG